MSSRVVGKRTGPFLFILFLVQFSAQSNFLTSALKVLHQNFQNFILLRPIDGLLPAAGTLLLLCLGFPGKEAMLFQICIMKTFLFEYIENSISKNWKFSNKKSDIFHISAQNIDWGYSLEPPRRGGSNEYPQSMFLSRNKKNNVYPCKPQFYYIIVGFKGVNII